MKEFIVVFTGVDVDVPVKERTFDTKVEANNYKHEHKYGKFATVLRTTGTFTE